jgi:hypothetical protein
VKLRGRSPFYQEPEGTWDALLAPQGLDGVDAHGLARGNLTVLICIVTARFQTDLSCVEKTPEEFESTCRPAPPL